MQFRAPAPANLTQEGSIFYADWSVADSNFGYSKAEVESLVSATLNNPQGWSAAGIQFRHVASGAVIFQVVETIAGPPNNIGLAHWNSDPVLVELEAATLGPDVITHEAGHAFFLAQHTPSGTDSVMEPVDEIGVEWPSASDLAAVEAWLAGDSSDTVFWFPGDLPYYITKWIVPVGSKARLVLTILEGAPVVMRAVCSADHSAMLSGAHQPFGLGIDASEQGFFHSEWTDAPSGELYVGVIVEGATPEDFQNLTVGLADVQIAAPSATGGGTPIPN